MKFQTSMLIFGAAFFLSASELVQNGSFSNGLEHWQVPKEGSDPYTASELDKTVSADSGSKNIWWRSLSAKRTTLSSMEGQ